MNPHKWIWPIGVALGIVLLLHTFVITFFTVTSNDFSPLFTTGDKVVVSRLVRTQLQRGDYLVYTDSVRHYLAKIEAMPGDTISYQGRRYRLPYRCCANCPYQDCRYLLLNTGQKRQLVHQHLIVGKIIGKVRPV